MTGRSLLPWALPVVILLLAGGLRFWRLGDWSFADEEFVTFTEVDSLFGQPQAEDLSSAADRLPRIVPVSYSLSRLSYALFGRDERGARTMCALFGTAGVVLVFVLLRGPLGLAGAATTSLLLAFWPDNILHSQQNRFYAFAWFFGTATMLLGARALKERSVRSAVLACVAGVIAVFCHTVVALVVAVLPVALLLGFRAESKREPAPPRDQVRRILLVPVVALGVLFVAYLVYIRPLMGKWNEGESWGYGPLHSLMGTVNSLGLPVALCAAPGAILAFRWRDGQGRYWLSFAVLLVVAALVLPKVTVYHPHYAAPLSLGAFVCVGLLVQWMTERARETREMVLFPLAAVAAFSLLNAQGIMSYYKDGSRDDNRGVARFLAARWKEGDRLVAHSPLNIRLYAPQLTQVHQLRGWSLEDLRGAAGGPGRAWIVVRTNRTGIPEPIRAWLGENCKWVMLSGQPRFDYSEQRMFVFFRDGG